MCLPVFFFSATILPAMVIAADTIRDPMQPPAYALKQFKLAKLKSRGAAKVNNATIKKAPGKPLRLSTILIGQARKIAIINDRMLVEGDTVDNARVVRIQKDRVELVRKGKRIKLMLDNNLISIRKNPVKSNL